MLFAYFSLYTGYGDNEGIQSRPQKSAAHPIASCLYNHKHRPPERARWTRAEKIQTIYVVNVQQELQWVVIGQNIMITALYFRVWLTEQRGRGRNIRLMTSCLHVFFWFSLNHRGETTFFHQSLNKAADETRWRQGTCRESALSRTDLQKTQKYLVRKCALSPKEF